MSATKHLEIVQWLVCHYPDALDMAVLHSRCAPGVLCLYLSVYMRVVVSTSGVDCSECLGSSTIGRETRSVLRCLPSSSAASSVSLPLGGASAGE